MGFESHGPFSGRGYWQELVESLIWVHCQLQVVPSIQPNALSITINSTTSTIHFLGGGIVRNPSRANEVFTKYRLDGSRLWMAVQDQ